MPKHKCKLTEGIRKKYTCFWRDHNEFGAKRMVCIPGMLESVANKGLLDIEVLFETKNILRIFEMRAVHLKELSCVCTQVKKEMKYKQKGAP
jgi:hypothetical protein